MNLLKIRMNKKGESPMSIATASDSDEMKDLMVKGGCLVV